MILLVLVKLLRNLIELLLWYIRTVVIISFLYLILLRPLVVGVLIVYIALVDLWIIKLSFVIRLVLLRLTKLVVDGTIILLLEVWLESR